MKEKKSMVHFETEFVNTLVAQLHVVLSPVILSHFCSYLKRRQKLLWPDMFVQQGE